MSGTEILGGFAGLFLMALMAGGFNGYLLLGTAVFIGWCAMANCR